MNGHTAGFIAKNATIAGDVTLGADVSVFFGAVIRTESEPILVGEGSNIQDNCVLHADPGFPVTVGHGCTVGHAAILHGCTVGDNTLIGMGAIVLNGAKIGKNCLVGAGAMVTQGMEIPDGSLVVGFPAKVRRALTAEEIETNRASARAYIAEGQAYHRQQAQEV